MLLRLGANAAGHAITGFAVGMLGVLAACTVARSAMEVAKARAVPGPKFSPPPDPFAADRPPR